MSVVAVNEIEPRSGSEVSVVPGNSIAADGVKADTFESRSGNGTAVNGAVVHPPIVLTTSTGILIDFSQSNVFKCTLAHDPTFTFTGLSDGGFYIIHLNPNGSPRTLTWPGGLMWVGAALTALVAGNRYIVTVSYVDTVPILSSALAS